MYEDMPWKNEPDSWEGEESGLHCRIVRQSWSGHLCGYVGVTKDHPLFARDYNNCPGDIECHGGLTFSGHFKDSDESIWYFGFDCAHSGDLAPYQYERGDLPYEGETYKTIDYVKSEILALALRLSQEPQPEKAQAAFEKWFPTFDGYSTYEAAKQSWDAALEWIRIQ
jgi:hypothetical protein